MTNDVERAVERLTQEHTEQTEAGPVEWPPLLTWLNEAVTEQVKRGQAGSGGTGSPIDLAALDLLNRIETGIAYMRQALYLPREKNPIPALTGAWEVAEQYQQKGELEPQQWERICETITGWVTEIEQEWDDRTRIMELTVPCPRCETRWVLEDQDGQEKRRAAVRIEYADGRAPIATCHVDGCDAIWVGWAAMTELGYTLNATPNLEVLAACGIDMPGIISA